jgi:hypothetical protein
MSTDDRRCHGIRGIAARFGASIFVAFVFWVLAILISLIT